MTNPFSRTRRLAALALAAASLVGATVFWRPVPVAAAQDPDPGSVAFYTLRVKPIFDANCARCHGGMNHRGGLNMETRAALLKGGHHGPALVPGDTASLLVKLIRHEGPADDPMPMPQSRPKLAEADIAVVAAWVKAGAPMPEPAQ